MKKKRLSFSIVGPGRVGSSLGMALVASGCHCDSIVVDKSRKSGLDQLERYFPGVPVLDSVSSLTREPELILVTVSDDAIQRMAQALSMNHNQNFRKTVVLHVSGIVPVSVLNSLKRLGASVGAFHPVSSFANRFSPGKATGIFYDFFGDGRASYSAGRLAGLLSSKIIRLKGERQREEFHLASVIVSNFTTLGIWAAEELISDIRPGSNARSALECLLDSTVSNLSARHLDSVLTGPLARGDVRVIASHLKALESNPVLLQFYRSTSLLGVDMLLKSGRTPARRRKLIEIRKLLEG